MDRQPQETPFILKYTELKRHNRFWIVPSSFFFYQKQYNFFFLLAEATFGTSNNFKRDLYYLRYVTLEK